MGSGQMVYRINVRGEQKGNNVIKSTVKQKKKGTVSNAGMKYVARIHEIRSKSDTTVPAFLQF